MSLPDTPTMDKSFEEVLSDVIDSIAKEEEALSHMLDAQTRQIQLTTDYITNDGVDLQKLIEVNSSAAALLEQIKEMQLILKNKLRIAVDRLPPCEAVPCAQLPPPAYPAPEPCGCEQCAPGPCECEQCSPEPCGCEHCAPEPCACGHGAPEPCMCGQCAPGQGAPQPQGPEPCYGNNGAFPNMGGFQLPNMGGFQFPNMGGFPFQGLGGFALPNMRGPLPGMGGFTLPNLYALPLRRLGGLSFLQLQQLLAMQGPCQCAKCRAKQQGGNTNKNSA